MIELQDTIFAIEKGELLPKVMEKKNHLWRLVQICCAFAEEHYEVTYSFASGYKIENFRVVVEKEEEVPSISAIYDAAVFYENEMHELFGLQVEHMVNDLHDKLYRINEETPFLHHLPPAPPKPKAPAQAPAAPAQTAEKKED